jgi:putative transposase
MDMTSQHVAEPQSSGHQALRHGRTSSPSQVYLITVVCHRRRAFFSDDDVARRVASVAASPRLWRDSKLLAWVLMPDHWHGMLELGRVDTLATAVGRMKAVTSRLAKPLLPDADRLWAAAFHDRALRREEDVVASARYIVANPLRSGLVAHIGDYPYWNAIWL